MDYEALAKQFGGAAATTGSAPTDYEALAKQFGGATATPASVGEGMPTGREVDNSAAQWLGMANRALAPYATAAGAGALAGAPFAGVGAPIGAAMGVTALGLGDIGTSLYNLGAGALGGKQAPLPSETIRDVYGAVGVGRKPQGATQEFIYSGLEGGASAGLQAKAINELASLARNSTTRNVLREFSAQPGAQATVGAGAAMAPELAQQVGVEDPRLLALSSVAGGLAGSKVANIGGKLGQTAESAAKRVGGKITSQKTATVEELKAAADEAYKRADASGVVFSPQSYDSLVDDINSQLKREGFIPKLDPAIANAVNVLDDYRGQPLSLTQLKELRSGLSGLKISPDANIRRRAGDIVARIDDYIEKPAPNAIIAGDEAGIAALNEGRAMWSRMRKSETLEDILADVDLRTPEAADTIRSRFAGLAANKRKMLGFTEDERAAIRQIGEGKATPSVFNTISKMSPGTNTRGLIMSGLLGGSILGGYAADMSPETMVLLGAAGGGARLTKSLRNALAKQKVSNLAAGVRRGDVQAPYAVQPNALVSPISQQFLNSLANQTGQ